MKKLILALLLMLSPSFAFAQASQRNPCYYPSSTSTGCIPVSSTNPLPVAATATLSGFAPSTYGTPISVTSSNSTGTLPAGTVVVATNVGTTQGAYCKLGASSDTSGQYISPGGGWFAFTVGAATQLTCVTSSSTTTMNMVGGSGLPTGTGGGSGGSGGGGAVTIADGADVAEGAKADAAYAGSGSASVIAALKGIYASVNGSVPAGSAIIGKVGIDQTTPGTTNAVSATNFPATVSTGTGAQGASSPRVTVATDSATVAGSSSLPAGTNYVGKTRGTDGTNDAVIDPCESNAQTSTPISITTATTTRIVTPTSAKKTYICYLLLTSAAADNVAIVEGTGGTCGTGTAGVVGGTTAANGLNFSANGGVSMTAGGKVAVAVTAGTNVDLCLITSAATPLAGVIKWVQQ